MALIDELVRIELTTQDDVYPTGGHDRILFGMAGNDRITSTNNGTSIMVGGLGNDIYSPGGRSFTIVVEAGGDPSDSYIDPSGGSAAAYAAFRIGVNDLAIIDSASNGVLFIGFFCA